MLQASRIVGTLVLVLSVMGSAQARNLPAARVLKVMGYNPQNLFDTVDSPNTDDVEFTPNGKQAWTEQVLADKMVNLGEVISSENPDVVGFTEVENEAVFELFMSTTLRRLGYEYSYVATTQDGRGIRNAVASKLPIVATKSHNISKDSWVEGGKVKGGRDILEVTIDTGIPGQAKLVTVMMNHWMSKAGGPIRDGWRQEEARSLSKIMADIVRKDETRLVIALGDFNDTLESKPIKQGMPLVPNYDAFRESNVEAIFAADSQLSGLQPVDSGTHYFHPGKEWSRLDHVFIAQGSQLKKNRVPGFHYVDRSVRVVKPRFVDEAGLPKGCELVFNRQTPNPERRDRCLDGVSDHRPIVAEFLAE